MSPAASSPHEMKAWLTYPGLSPYWALSSFVNPLDGGFSDELVELPTGPNGATERATLRFNYHSGQIKPRLKDSRDPEKGMWELDIHWSGRGERKASFQIKPRWKEMVLLSGKPLNTPFDHVDDHDEATAIFVQGSNLEPDEYPAILREVCSALAEMASEHWHPNHFQDPLPDPVSQVIEHERYYRAHRDHTDAVAGSGGLLSKLQHLFSTEEGTKTEYVIDNTETVGYQSRAWLPDHSTDPLPGLEHGVKLEWYHPEHVRSEERLEDGDALAHPKFEALFARGGDKRPKLNDETIPWSQRHDLVANLEEFLINSLSWAGVPTDADDPDENVFVPDDHFTVRETDRHLQRYDDPTPDIEVSRESALVRTLADAKDRDVSLLQTLVADGGRTHYGDLADELGSVSTVYRALDELNELVHNQNGVVEFVCEKIHDDLREVFELAERGLGQVEYARKATEHLLRMSEDVLGDAGESLQKWVQKWGVQLAEDDSSGRLKMKFDAMLSRFASVDAPSVSDVLDAGLTAWRNVGRDPRDFEEATVIYHEKLGNQTVSKRTNRLR